MKVVKCMECGHEGDLHESVYFTGRTDVFRYALQCSQCGSWMVRLEEVLDDEDKKL